MFLYLYYTEEQNEFFFQDQNKLLNFSIAKIMVYHMLKVSHVFEILYAAMYISSRFQKTFIVSKTSSQTHLLCLLFFPKTLV